MNERIQELWEQAVHGDGPHASVIADFAELIVLECVDIIEKLPPGYKDYRDQIEDAFRVSSIVEIKHHFGNK